MFFPCLYVKILDRTSPPKLLDGFTSNFQELLLRIPIFAWYSVVRLSVCLSVKKLDRTSPPKLLDGFTSNFQELLLRIPIFACSSVVRLSVCQNTWVRRLTPALALKYFVLVHICKYSQMKNIKRYMIYLLYDLFDIIICPLYIIFVWIKWYVYV